MKIVEQGVVAIISILADSYQESTYTYCARALCNLACAEGARLRVATEGGRSLTNPSNTLPIPTKHPLIHPPTHPLTLVHPLFLLLLPPPGMRVLLMIGMVRSVDIHTKYWCVVALCNLLDMTTIDFMIEEGLVTATANLSR